MEPIKKLTNNFIRNYRYDPYKIIKNNQSYSDKPTAFSFQVLHEIQKNYDKIQLPGPLYLDRKVPLTLPTFYDRVTDEMIKIYDSNAMSHPNGASSISLDNTFYSEQLHRYNIVTTWSNNKFIKKGIIPGELLFVRKKLDVDYYKTAIYGDSYITKMEDISDSLNDFIVNDREIDTCFYGEYVPLSILTQLDKTLSQFYKHVYGDDDQIINELSDCILKPSKVSTNPIGNFLSYFDIIGIYMSNEIENNPSTLTEQVQFVSRGSLYSAKHFIETNNFKTDFTDVDFNGDITIPNDCFLDLDQQDGDFITGDQFSLYFCLVKVKDSELRLFIAKSKKSERYVCSTLLNIVHIEEKTLNSNFITATDFISLFDNACNKYYTPNCITAAIKRIGFSTIGSANCDDWVYSSPDLVKIKRFFLDIGNKWYKI